MSTRPLSPARQAAENLARRLREIRRSSGLTGRALAAIAGWHFTKVSRLENGNKTPTEAELRLWCRLCDAEDQLPDLLADVRALESMYQEYKRQTRAGMKRLMRTSVPLYERTTRFRIYEHNVIPGLFQTPEYAAAMLSFWIEFLETPNDLDEAIAARIRRQQVVRDPARRIEVVIEEQALRVWFGGAAVQAGQLERLLAVQRLPNVSLGIIPMMIVRPCVASSGFWIFDDELAILETPTAGIEVTRPGELDLYVRMFGLLTSVAQYGEAARELIVSALRDLAN
ncbi:helix-turn-helix domain-containing protein [Planotetraspora kaengkrachanensis]|uniref:Transcriptional regulator n=1 Tax=Planotetraspora kaengkrachanensis TaxID=575193 RepID=A0A8J3PW01_9ACTN|nr:helix-turn-helix transcriptional regulator [Planotetraspora kaengkrachanensis]GIG82097.1 transcriptional regulator [Planotetraspora kaengkrachanensis]